MLLSDNLRRLARERVPTVPRVAKTGERNELRGISGSEASRDPALDTVGTRSRVIRHRTFKKRANTILDVSLQVRPRNDFLQSQN